MKTKTKFMTNSNRSSLRRGLFQPALSVASAVLTVLMALCPTQMHATSSEALTFASTSDEVFPGYTVGWAFDVSVPVTVTNLGWFDDQATLGFASDHPVGIFSAGGSLLVSTTVTTADPLTMSSGSQPGFGFRYHAIAPFTLQPGSYVIAGLSPFGTEDGFYDFGSAVTTPPGITYIEGRYINSATLTYPSTPADRGISYFGPNFQFTIPTQYLAQVQPPINADGASIFAVKRGVVPVKFTLTQDGVAICDLPPAALAVARTGGGVIGQVNESIYSGTADAGSNFRIDNCQYVYNLNSRVLGVGIYRVDILINGQGVGSATFELR